jgi:hypothetical protein
MGIFNKGKQKQNRYNFYAEKRVCQNCHLFVTLRYKITSFCEVFLTRSGRNTMKLWRT